MKWDNVFPEVPENFHSRVTQTLESQIIHNKKNAIAIKPKRFIMLMAVVVLTCSILLTAFAFTMWNPKLAEYFGVSEVQQRELLKGGTAHMLNSSASDNGLTIEAIQSLADKNGMYILFRVTTPEGIQLSDKNLFDKQEIKIEGFDNFNFFSNFLSEEPLIEEGYVLSESQNIANNWYFNIWIFNNEQADLSGKTISISFSNLQADAKKLDMYTVLEGNWELSWTLDNKDYTRTFIMGKSVTIGNYEVVIEAIELSPLSMTINYSGEGIKEAFMGNDMIYIPGLALKSGELFTAYGGPGSGGWTDSDFETYSVCQYFSNVLDVEQVTGISFSIYSWSEVEIYPIEIPLAQ